MMHFKVENVKCQLGRLSAAVPGGLDCVLWTGSTDRNGYGRIKVTWLKPDGSTASTTERAPRIAMMLKLDFNSKFDFQQYAATLEVSHLCHQRLCVNPAHLSLEPRTINTERVHCNLQGQCTQCHDGYPYCLFWYVAL